MRLVAGGDFPDTEDMNPQAHRDSQQLHDDTLFFGQATGYYVFALPC